MPKGLKSGKQTRYPVLKRGGTAWRTQSSYPVVTATETLRFHWFFQPFKDLSFFSLRGCSPQALWLTFVSSDSSSWITRVPVNVLFSSQRFIFQREFLCIWENLFPICSSQDNLKTVKHQRIKAQGKAAWKNHAFTSRSWVYKTQDIFITSSEALGYLTVGQVSWVLWGSFEGYVNAGFHTGKWGVTSPLILIYIAFKWEEGVQEQNQWCLKRD